MELPKTEAELDALISSKVEEAVKDLTSKHNGSMAKMRTDYESKIKDLEAKAELGKEEYAKQKLAEKNEAEAKELAELRAYKKGKVIEERLGKEGLPSYFKNDSRLLNASDDDFDKIVKDVKKEYEATLPKGNTHSTVVTTSGGKGVSTDTDKANAAFSASLKELIGR